MTTTFRMKPSAAEAAASTESATATAMTSAYSPTTATVSSVSTAHAAYGVHDAMRHGLRSVRHDLLQGHPLEAVCDGQIVGLLLLHMCGVVFVPALIVTVHSVLSLFAYAYWACCMTASIIFILTLLHKQQWQSSQRQLRADMERRVYGAQTTLCRDMERAIVGQVCVSGDVCCCCSCRRC